MATTTSAGKAAEAAVAEHLKKTGYEIIEMNWRRRVCEIDIVAKKDKVIYFTEVKYRSSDAQGSGLDYLTDKKLKQLEFAAQLWVAENNWPGDWRLLGAAVNSSKLNVEVENIIEL
ncbi:MAG TPA: YraN family protein [Candidatus Binatia bacterium]|nr:YraN family protein [Candidatus Binatia bacterium]